VTGRALRGGAALVAFAATALLGGQSRADPYLTWRTVESPHFRVHYHGGLAELAQRTASVAEASRERLRTVLGRAPDEITEIALSDSTDSANGSATALPYNAIRLYVTAPEDMAPLGDYDDWMVGLVTHEQTHIFHLDNMGGGAAILNRILGKAYAPNHVQPRWILEGLAVAMESRLTSGGRLRSSLFDMYLRADVQEHHLAGLDQMSHSVRRWPNGDIWYLYGGEFIGWIHDTYGPDTFAAVAADYGNNIVPWGINRSIRRATGHGYPELYDAWVRSLEARYGAEAAAVRARGLRVGTRLTHGGRVASSPRFVPRRAANGPREELLYYRDDGDRPSGFYRLPLVSRTQASEQDLAIVARASGSPGTASFDRDGGLVFDSTAPSVRLYDFNDLHHQPPRTTSPTGWQGTRERWTTGLRARSPDVSPNGRHVAFVTNHAGTTTLRIAEVRAEGGLGPMRRLVPSARYEQAYSPRFSPDGRRIAYSAWTRGGYRDIRVVDVETGSFFELSHDRASDLDPTWTPDGKHVLWSSDRSGIPNVYDYALETGQIRQVTNVQSGAFMPEVSPDGLTVVYVGYTSEGFDLFSMPLTEKNFLEPLPPRSRPEPPPEPARVQWPVRPYAPLQTLRPRSVSIDYGPGNFGQAIGGRVDGSDIVGLHSIGVSLTYQTAIDQWSGSVGYGYTPLPVSLSMSVFRDVVPRASFKVNDQRYSVRDEMWGATVGLGYSLPGEFDGQNVALSYTASSHSPRYAIGALNDPYSDVLARPSDYFLGSVRVAWSYANAYRPLYGVSNERGFTLALSSDIAGPATGSDTTLATVDGRATGYLLAPWASHHAFALALSAGSAGGSAAGRGYYTKGGFVDTPAFDAILSGLRQSAFPLRGFPAGAFGGRTYNLANLEYRFPIAWIDRGVSTLPAFAHAVSGAVFADCGGAYERIDPSDLLGQYHLGVGGELRLGFTLGYILDTSLRIGWARGFGDQGLAQTYVVVAGAF
jgi:hypothetical protein